MMPIPTHLQGLVVPMDDASNEEPLDATVRCPCHSESFEFLYPGDTKEHNGIVIPVTAERDGAFFFRIEARCMACRQVHLLFDKDFHGWDGYICHDQKQARLPRPALRAWSCGKCGSVAHRGRISIYGEGKDDFLEGAAGFPPDRWPDGFGWFQLSIACKSCGNEIDHWVDYETM